MNLICKYCNKKLVNESAHSGHMRNCAKSDAIRKQFLVHNLNILGSQEVALMKWDSGDHQYFTIYKYETQSSEEAINYIVSNIQDIGKFPIKRITQYSIFYLLVLCQMADNISIREKTFDFLKKLVSENQIAILFKYWKKLGAQRYLPINDSYFKSWEKFVRIKEDCFFNIDYPLWILFFDRYLLTFKMFGWQQNPIPENKDYFKDILLINLKNLFRLEQDFVGLSTTSNYYTHVPRDIVKYLHPLSKNRFLSDNENWLHVSNLDYDPRKPESALIV